METSAKLILKSPSQCADSLLQRVQLWKPTNQKTLSICKVSVGWSFPPSLSPCQHNVFTNYLGMSHNALQSHPFLGFSRSQPKTSQALLIFSCVLCGLLSHSETGNLSLCSDGVWTNCFCTRDVHEVVRWNFNPTPLCKSIMLTLLLRTHSFLPYCSCKHPSSFLRCKAWF